jgi:hypothetical protein
MFSLIIACLLAGLGVMVLMAGVVLKKAAEVAVEREYATWAPALARLLVRVAGFVYRPQRDRWWADLVHDQKEAAESGLPQALWCLLGSPGLLLRDAVGAARAHRRPLVSPEVLTTLLTPLMVVAWAATGGYSLGGFFGMIVLSVALTTGAAVAVRVIRWVKRQGTRSG